MIRNKKKSLCGAKTKKENHEPCKRPSMKNGRCRLHGGLSTGPKTKAGKARIGASKYKHGLYTKEGIKDQKRMREMMKWRDDLDDLVEMDNNNTIFLS